MPSDRAAYWSTLTSFLALSVSILRVVVLLGYVPSGTPNREDVLSRFLERHGEPSFEDPTQVFGLIGRVENALGTPSVDPLVNSLEREFSNWAVDNDDAPGRTFLPPASDC
jgi:hypothetical protein